MEATVERVDRGRFSLVNSNHRTANCSHVVFPNIFPLLRILAVLPVTTVEPERVFSKVEKTLTSLRSKMGEE